MFNWKFKIGTKLGITSGVAVWLVAARVISKQMSGDSIGDSNTSALNQEEVAKKVIEVKAAARGMQVAVRDLRLAKSPEQVKAALDNLNAGRTLLVGQIDAAMSLLTRPENRERLTRIRGLGEEYFAAGNEIAKADDQQKERLARERGLPTAAAIEKAVDEVLGSVSKLAESAARDSAAMIVQAGRIGLGLGVFVILV